MVISLSEFRGHMKMLRNIAHFSDVKLVIYRRPHKIVRHIDPNTGHPAEFRASGVFGYYAQNLKSATISIFGNPSRSEVLHTIAHEIRHAIHVKEGLFKDYYRPKDATEWLNYALGSTDERPRAKLQNLRTAWMAEIDCNKWADQFLIDRGLLPLNEPYNYKDTAAYRIRVLIRERDNSLKTKVK